MTLEALAYTALELVLGYVIGAVLVTAWRAHVCKRRGHAWERGEDGWWCARCKREMSHGDRM